MSEARTEKRVPVSLPVALEAGVGVTRNVSASGVFFETDAVQRPGTEISFEVEFDSPGGKLMLKCRGLIVRVENRGGKVGVAAKITESQLQPVGQVAQQQKFA